jgi:hypothetical protein
MLIPDAGISPDEEDFPKNFFHHRGIFSMP